MDIADLNLSVRDFNAVKRFGINSTEELIERLPDFCKEHRRTGAKVTEALHKLGLLPFHLGEWIEPERCAEELATEEFREGTFIIMGFPTESRDDRKVVLIIKIDGDQLYFIDGKSDLMHHTIGDRTCWHIAEEIGDALAKHREEVWEENRKADEPNAHTNSTVIVSEDYTRAVSLTRSIIANAQAAQQSLYEVCKGLKEMRDMKLYKELGYSNFADFCENETGIKISQAKKYVAIADRMTDETASQLAKVSTEKLYMLAMLDEPTRQEVTESIDVESVTVRELRNEINRITSENADLGKKLDAVNEVLETRSRQWKASLDSKQNELDELRAGNKRRYDTLFNKIKDLNAQLAEAKEAASQEVAVEDTSRIEELEQQLAECKRKLDERPMVQTALPGDGGERRRGEYAAISNAVEHAMEDLIDFLEDNDHCSDFRYFANRAKEKLREYNSEINDMLAKEETQCQ